MLRWMGYVLWGLLFWKLGGCRVISSGVLRLVPTNASSLTGYKVVEIVENAGSGEFDGTVHNSS